MQTIIAISSAYNEEMNIPTLHKYLQSTFDRIQSSECIDFKILLVDNMSTDGTARELADLVRKYPNVTAYSNLSNYGPELSTVFACQEALKDNPTYIFLLCSDLQDPPEMLIDMYRRLAISPSARGILGVKSVLSLSSRNFIFCWLNHLYYFLLRFASRQYSLPHGFHGFGLYHAQTIRDALDIYERTQANLRVALWAATNNPELIEYNQQPRQTGASTYSTVSYILEAIDALFASKLLPARILIRISTAALFLLVCIIIYNLVFIPATVESLKMLLANLFLFFSTLYLFEASRQVRRSDFFLIKSRRIKVYSRKINPGV